MFSRYHLTCPAAMVNQWEQAFMRGNRFCQLLTSYLTSTFQPAMGSFPRYFSAKGVNHDCLDTKTRSGFFSIPSSIAWVTRSVTSLPSLKAVRCNTLQSTL